MLKGHIVIASMRQLQYVPSTYVTQYKENYLEIYICQVACPLSSPILNIPYIFDTVIIYEGGSICNENPFITPSPNALGLPFAKRKIKALPL